MPDSIRTRVRALPAFCGLAAIGGILLWLALSGLLPVFKAMEAGAPMVALAPHDAFGLPLSVSFFALAGMTLCPMPTIGPGRKRQSRTTKIAQRPDIAAMLLGVAVVAAMLTLVASPITELLMQSTMSAHGYARCAAVLGERHAPLRWILVGTADANARCPMP